MPQSYGILSRKTRSKNKASSHLAPLCEVHPTLLLPWNSRSDSSEQTESVQSQGRRPQAAVHRGSRKREYKDGVPRVSAPAAMFQPSPARSAGAARSARRQ